MLISQKNITFAREITKTVRMERVKTDNNNMRAEGYLLDTQRLTTPPCRIWRGIQGLWVIAIALIGLCACASESDSDIDDNLTRTSVVDSREATLLMSQLEGVGKWDVESIIQKSGDVTLDLAWSGMSMRFENGKVVFIRECIAYGTDNPTVEETLGEYSVEYLNENYLYIGGEKFDVIFTGKNSLTLKSEKIIISITN